MFDHLWDCLALRKLSPLIFWEGVEGARRKQSRTAREYCAERHFQVYLTYPYCMTPISLLFIAVQVENFRSQRGELISPLVIIDSHNVHIRSAFRNQNALNGAHPIAVHKLRAPKAKLAYESCYIERYSQHAFESLQATYSVFYVKSSMCTRHTVFRRRCRRVKRSLLRKAS